MVTAKTKKSELMSAETKKVELIVINPAASKETFDRARKTAKNEKKAIWKFNANYEPLNISSLILLLSAC